MPVAGGPLDEWFGIGGSMRALVDRIPDVANDAQPVLIVGESGTGRRTLARFIHHNSARATSRFSAIGLASLPATLVDCELFGVPNSPFGSRSCRAGLFQRASGGTLYLGDVHAMEVDLQHVVLAWLRVGEISIRVFAEWERRLIDARLVTSTRPQALHDGTLDALIPDLLARAGSTVLYLAALRDRRADIPELVSFFAYWADRFKCRNLRGIEDDVMHLLSDYSWPVNVRQLESVVGVLVERADGSKITLDDLRRLAFTCPLHPDIEKRLDTWADKPHESFDAYLRRRL